MSIRFGPSGNSDSFYAQGYDSTAQQPKWLKDLGLNAYEYSFGKGVRIRQETAELIGANAKENGIALSVHAPYYINLSATEEQQKQNNIRYIIQSARAANWMGAKRAIFHPGMTGEGGREESLKRIKEAIPRIFEALGSEGLSEAVTLCPETMGKISQIGDLEEILQICLMDERLLPCVDFGHLYARSLGQFFGEQAYDWASDLIANTIGSERANKFHIHFSRIEFTKAGEKKHWTYADTQYGPDFEPLARVLVKKRLEPVVICESRGTMAEDALTFKSIYEGALEAEK